MIFSCGDSDINCISGDCKNGQGIYTYANGDKYEGEFKDGLKHGKGAYIFSTGDKYVGEYKYGLKEGKGTYTNADIRNDLGVRLRAGNKYVGEWKNDKQHGQGTYTWHHGGKYVGEWKDGKMHGKGTWEAIRRFLSRNIVMPTHEYRSYDNCHNGSCLATPTPFIANSPANSDFLVNLKGDKYVGEFKDNRRNGKGTYTSNNGKIYQGLWKNDKFIAEPKPDEEIDYDKLFGIN
jgi:hypothetical protein